MKDKCGILLGLLAMGALTVQGGDKSIVSLKGFCETELKAAGFVLPQQATLHIKAVGGGGSYGWTSKSRDLFAYGWIINGDTRQLVWKMDVDNTSRNGGYREFNDKLTLQAGSYEVYFAVPTFSYHTAWTHININIDHRQERLFGWYEKTQPSEKLKNNILGFLKKWWSDDVVKEWEKRCGEWGIEILAGEEDARRVRTYTPPKEIPNTVVRVGGTGQNDLLRVGSGQLTGREVWEQIAGKGENDLLRIGLKISEPISVNVYALGEAQGDNELYDYAWIVRKDNRSRVWEMSFSDCGRAGGASKNIECSASLNLEGGEYILYFVTDDSHSPLDWNAPPPFDPFFWGVTLSVKRAEDKGKVKVVPYDEDENTIVAIRKVRDDESRTTGFTLKADAEVRIYAFGERGLSSRALADYGYIMDARTRQKVWTMDVDRTLHAGGASKNRYVDEVITLPKGSYIVAYRTDDSHSYGDWNSKPPFDPARYGITVMGVGPKFSKNVVAAFADQPARDVVAQIVRVGDDVDEVEQFKLSKTTRLRIYAIGEGEKRQMYDYGWIEDAKAGRVVWEMTYGSTFHAGGGKKNRMVNTSLVLEKGTYRLRYKSDDSHSYNDWNVDPPEDQTFWGITVYREGDPLAPAPPKSPVPPEPPLLPEPPEAPE